MIILRQKEFGNKANKALKNKFIADKFGQTSPYTSGESALQGGRRVLRTQEITRIGELKPGEPNMFLAGNGGSYKGVNGIINGTVSKSKGQRISQLSESNRKKFLDKHNLEYNLETNSYVKKAPKNTTQTIPSPSTSPSSATETKKVVNSIKAKPIPKQTIGETKKNEGIIKKAVNLAKANPKTTAGIAVGGALVAGGGIAAKKYRDKKRQQ
jgi:hypothetical protein